MPIFFDSVELTLAHKAQTLIRLGLVPSAATHLS